jgi:hypothetical protein
MSSTYDLSGTFVECCDCFTVCPCWVADKPDDDHCSGLYVWTFDQGSRIAGFDVSHKSVAAATFHGNRTGGQAVLFADQTLVAPARNALIEAFSGRREGPLQDLAKLLGTIISSEPAIIETKFDADEFRVSVTVRGSKLASANGKAKYLDNQADPMTLNNSALETELGIQGLVEVQDMDNLSVSVATLPGGAYQFTGRSGMRGSFVYR